MDNLNGYSANIAKSNVGFYDGVKPYKLTIQIIAATVALFAIGQLIFGRVGFWYDIPILIGSYFLAAGLPVFYVCMTKDRIRDRQPVGEALICSLLAAIYFIPPMLVAAMLFLVVVAIPLGIRDVLVGLRRRLFMHRVVTHP
jgi:hypothetical protein